MAKQRMVGNSQDSNF